MCSLLTLSSKLVAKTLPFYYIEERCKLIPEPVQRLIIFYSFPRNVKDVYVYCQNSSFKESDYQVFEVIQVGFVVSGVVRGTNGEFVVRLGVDRCKITSTNCSCNTRLIFWCDHVVALALYRVKNADTIQVRVPISETLHTLSRPQLQKLLQYLLHEHPSVLPSAQKLADNLLESNSVINCTNGAPDLTAGGGKEDDDCSWALGCDVIEEMIGGCGGEEAKLGGVVGLVFRKTSQMTTTSDPNAPKLLTTLTTSFLKNLPPSRNDLWDQLTQMWHIQILNNPQTKNILKNFISHPNMPMDENNEPLLKTCLNLSKNTEKYNSLKIISLHSHGKIREAEELAGKFCRKLTEKNFDLDLNYCIGIFKVTNNAEFAILALAQGRNLLPNLYLQERWVKNEQKFLNLLNRDLKSIFEKLFDKLLSKKYTNLQMPLYNFGKFVFKNSENFKLSHKYLKMQIPNNSLISNTLELQQIGLALVLINASAKNKENLQKLSKTIQNFKSTSSIFKIAQESQRLSENENSLLFFTNELALHLLKLTSKNSRRRWDILRFSLNVTLACGYNQLLFLLKNWSDYLTPNEAVGTVASQALSRGTTLRLGLSYSQSAELGGICRGVALGAMGEDPTNCALNALTICESDQGTFETAYNLIVEAGKKMQLSCQQIFTIARYMEHRGYPLRGYKLGVIGVGRVLVPFNQETHSSISDIHWTCALAQNLGDTELSNLLPLIISNIKCASVLSEILKRAASAAAVMEPPFKKSRPNSTKIYSRLKLLVEATIASYVSTIHNRLSHISPRHYSDFIEYLSKAKEVFLYAPEGLGAFRGVVGGIKREYKGKKKLVVLLEQRFGV